MGLLIGRGHAEALSEQGCVVFFMEKWKTKAVDEWKNNNNNIIMNNVCFVSVLPRRPTIQAFVCLMLDKRFAKTFSQVFLHPDYKNNMKEKLSQQWIRRPVYGESDGANFILVEDWIRELWLFK